MAPKTESDIWNSMIKNDNMFAQPDATRVQDNFIGQQPTLTPETGVNVEEEIISENEKFNRFQFIKAGIKDLFHRPTEGGVLNNIREDKFLVYPSEDGYKLDRGSYKQGDNLMEYINKVDLEDSDLQWIREKVRIMASGPYTARRGKPTFFGAIDVVLNSRGSYYGQNYRFTGDPVGYKDANARNRVKDAPDLLGIHLGFIDPEDSNLRETSLRPSGGYPFPSKIKGKATPTVYSANDFINFQGFRGSGVNKLYSDIMNLKKGQIIPLNQQDQVDRDVFIHKYESIDFGMSSWTIGRNEEGALYLAFADSWDFKGGSLGPYGDFMDKVGVNDLHFYGRFPISEMHFMQDDTFLSF